MWRMYSMLWINCVSISIILFRVVDQESAYGHKEQENEPTGTQSCALASTGKEVCNNQKTNVGKGLDQSPKNGAVKAQRWPKQETVSERIGQPNFKEKEVPYALQEQGPRSAFVITDNEREAEERITTDTGNYQAVYNGYKTVAAPIRGQGVNYGEQAQQNKPSENEEVWSEIGGGPNLSQGLGVWNWYRERWRGRSRSRARRQRVLGKWRSNNRKRKGGWNEGGGGWKPSGRGEGGWNQGGGGGGGWKPSGGGGGGWNQGGGGGWKPSGGGGGGGWKPSGGGGGGEWKPSGAGGGGGGGGWNQGRGRKPFGVGGGSTQTGSSTSQSDGAFEQDALEAHNNFRRVHNAPDMKLNRQLSDQAKVYAQKIANAGALKHSKDAERGSDVGENLAMGCKTSGIPLTGKEAVTNWYNEICEYDFNNPGFSMATGHFTQVVWKNSVELGMGKAPGTLRGLPCIFVVSRYRPAGNYVGQYKDNVLRGGFQRSYCNNISQGKSGRK